MLERRLSTLARRRFHRAGSLYVLLAALWFAPPGTAQQNPPGSPAVREPFFATLQPITTNNTTDAQRLAPGAVLPPVAGRWRVQLGTGLKLDRVGAQRELQLPGAGAMNVRLAQRNSHAPGLYSQRWVGVSDAASRLVMTYGPDRAHGFINFRGRIYNLESTADGTFELTDKRAAGIRRVGANDGDGTATPPRPTGRASFIVGESGFDSLTRNLQLRPSQDSVVPSDPTAAAVAPTGTQIDVLVFVTVGFDAEYGAGNGYLTKVLELFEISNDALFVSGVPANIQLVEARRLLAGDYDPDKLAPEALRNAISVDPGIAATRNKYGADLVVLLRPFKQAVSPGSCGIAFIPPSTALAQNTGFNVTNVGDDGNRGCSEYTMIHEIGHNWGNQHDRAAPHGVGMYPYSYGYRAVGDFGTIMAYEADNEYEAGVFSNPNIYCGFQVCGVPVGQPNPAYNVLSMTNVRAKLAVYRPTVTPPYLTSVTASDGEFTDKVRVTWAAPTTPYHHYEVLRAGDKAMSAPTVVTSSSWDDPEGAYGINYYYVRACTATVCGMWSFGDPGYRRCDGGNCAAIPAAFSASDATAKDRVKLKWNAVPNAVMYRVGMSARYDAPYAIPFQEIMALGDTTTADVDVPDTTFRYFAVRACTGGSYAECGRWSVSDYGYRDTFGAKPVAPQGFVVTPGDQLRSGDSFYTQSGQLAWKRAADAHYYDVYRATAPENVFLSTSLLKRYWTGDEALTLVNGQWVVIGDKYQVFDTPPTIADRYYYGFRVVNDKGESVNSPALPGFIRPVRPDPSASNDAFPTKIQVSWLASPSANLYRVYRSLQPTSASATKIAETTTPGYADTVVTPDVPYYYWVQACKSATTICSLMSETTVGSIWSFKRSADVRVSFRANSLPLVPNGPFDEKTFLVEARNAGPNVGIPVVLNLVLPVLTDANGYSPEIFSAKPAQGSCVFTAFNATKCNLGAIAVGQTVLVTVVVGAPRGMLYDLRASASIAAGISGASVADGDSSKSSQWSAGVRDMLVYDALNAIVVLHNDGKTLETRNATTGALVQKVTTMSSASGKALLALPDSNGDGILEIGVLGARDSDRTGVLELWNVSARTTAVKRVILREGFEPHSFVSVGDADQNGKVDIAVLETRNSDARLGAEILNVSGTLNKRLITYAVGLKPIDFAAVPDSDGNRVPEVALLAKSLTDGSFQRDIRNASGDALPRLLKVGAGYVARALEVVPDSDKDGVPELATLLIKTSENRPYVEIASLRTGVAPRLISFNTGVDVLGLRILNDWDKNAVPEVGLLTVRRSDARGIVYAKNVTGTATLRTATLAAGDVPQAFGSSPLASTPGAVSVFVVHGADSTMAVEARLSTGALKSTVPFGVQ